MKIKNKIITSTAVIRHYTDTRGVQEWLGVRLCLQFDGFAIAITIICITAYTLNLIYSQSEHCIISVVQAFTWMERMCVCVCMCSVCYSQTFIQLICPAKYAHTWYCRSIYLQMRVFFFFLSHHSSSSQYKYICLQHWRFELDQLHAFVSVKCAGRNEDIKLTWENG